MQGRAPVPKRKVVFLLAFNENSSSDVARAGALRKRAEVYTVSEARAIGECHIEADFTTPVGLRHVVTKIQSVRERDVTVMLDYFWLQQSYYRYRYGMNWISTKAKILLNAGADRVILPVDRSGELLQMMQNEQDMSQYEAEFIALADNMLWVCSNDPDVEKVVRTERNVHNRFMSRRYLNRDVPFLCLRKREMVDWAQCDMCDKWRTVIDVPADDAAFDCSMVGLSCDAPALLWAQCVKCGKWRVVDVTHDDGFTCAIAGVTCSAPEDLA